MKISVITPSVRPEMLETIAKCLKRQDFTDFNWFICSPERMFIEIDRLIGHDYAFVFVPEPPKKEGDFYRLSGALNKGFQEADGELIIVIMDGNWFPPDTLSRFWTHYQADTKALIGAVGHQYDQIDQYGKPTNMMWQDPRARMDQGSFYEVAPSEIEFSMCSIPKRALLDCGGIDEIYDTCPAVGEKEMCWRLDKLGYKFYLDQTIEYRAIHHPRLTSNWEEMYLKVTTPLFTEHMNQLQKGQRVLKMPYVSKL